MILSTRGRLIVFSTFAASHRVKKTSDPHDPRYASAAIMPVATGCQKASQFANSPIKAMPTAIGLSKSSSKNLRRIYV